MNALFAGLALLAGAPGLKDTPAKPATVEGEWAVMSSVVGGKPDGILEKSPIDKIVITADKWQVVRGGRSEYLANLYVDPNKDPPHMDVGGGNGVDVCKAVYKLDGDTMTICYEINRDRPKKVESPEGTQIRMMVLKRLVK